MAPGGTYDALLRDAAVALTAAGIDNSRFEARLLLARAAGLSVEELVANGGEEAPPAAAEMLRTLTARRVQREPMAYILGEREFWGRPFQVSPDVLVPRADSETVIEAVLELVPDRGTALRIVDLGVGSGCLLLTLLAEYPGATGTGFDVSEGALVLARDNAAALGVAGRARWVHGDWARPGWVESLGGPFDLVVSNPPYIEAATIAGLMPEVAKFEPRLALDGGPDGLAAYREIAAASARLLASRGLLVVEVGAGQALAVKGLFGAAGLETKGLWKDLGGVERVVAAGQ
ncbi:MAG TPA: peptide chain release factor N(5)-glutamine methyltransferase [Reyranellaceae bacterium]|nr:peptide chain release factor N(5)-glutamine methyltransferase [Reyranellaceae bacterium]